jgi:hypothetical protein
MITMSIASGRRLKQGNEEVAGDIVMDAARPAPALERN